MPLFPENFPPNPSMIYAAGNTQLHKTPDGLYSQQQMVCILAAIINVSLGGSWSDPVQIPDQVLLAHAWYMIAFPTALGLDYSI